MAKVDKQLRKSIGKRVQLQRKIRNLTQQDLADKLNVPKSTLGMWESGRNAVPLEILVALSHLFDLNIDYWLGMNDSKLISIDGSVHLVYRSHEVPKKYIEAVKLMMDYDISSQNSHIS